ncbi:flagellar hook-length control protein FliK [Vibrio sinaloensis]|uniref:flagellar hook-length control protein FliK n=1 Tax=Photobacterium sp. (strain ATCC 43367) TaxID=379097 RepID=UPI00206A547C|nr:flagellar hook-length control protein FliK [Vibrio sinaloensis]UPQ87244.1 flagellar hook-length control protein FliK [Vibrio sinaloensis]
MNINLSSVSESPKATVAASEGGEATTETSESGGFFAKLAALIKGESSQETSEASVSAEKVAAEAEVTADGEASKTKVSSEKDQSTEVLLEQSNEADETQSVKAAKDSPEEKSDAAKIVSDNDQVLQRLDESNRALKAQDGKELPPQSSRAAAQSEAQQPGNEPVEASIDEETKLSVSSQEAKTNLNQQATADAEVVDTNKSVLKENHTQAVAAIDGEEADASSVNQQQTATIPASAQRFIEPSADETQVAQPAEDDQENLTGNGAAAAAAVSVAAVAQSQVNTGAEQIEIEPQQQDSLKPEQQADAVAEQPDKVVTGSATAVVSEAPSDVQASTLTSASLVAAGETATIAKAPQSMGAVAAGAVLTGAASSDGDSEQQISPELAAASTAAAIPWASAEQVSSDELKLKSELSAKPQQAAVAQSVHHAIVNQQAQAQFAQQALQASAAQAVPLPNDIAASQLQQLAAAPTAAVSQDQMLLKAALGAKVGAGQLTTGKTEGAQAGSESSSGFAQQLAQAAGQPGSNALTQARADQVAQAPLQLNRDLAGEQVAERMQMMMSKNLKNIDIRLDPPELGRMQIRMNMNGDAATVHFTVANQQARDVIEQSMPRLREMLAQQGVQLGDTSVQQQASGQQQKRYAEGGQGNPGQGGSSQGFQGEENLEPDINLDLNVAAKRDGISYYA